MIFICHSHLHQFADDITTYTSSIDLVSVHFDLASLSEWVTSNGFTVNVSIQSMLLSRRRHHHQLSPIQFLLNNVFFNLTSPSNIWVLLWMRVYPGQSRLHRFVRWLLLAKSVRIYLLMCWLLCTMLLFYFILTAMWFGISVPRHHLITFNMFRIMP